MSTVHVVVPAGVEDRTRPSGGNAYDLRVCAGLTAREWRVVRHDVPGPWPNAAAPDRALVASLLAGLPDDALVLVDGLVGSAVGAELEVAARRVAVVLLVHLPLGVLGGDELAASEVRAVEAAARVVATSRWSADWLVAHAAAPPDRVHVALPGTDPAPLAEPRQDGRRLLTVGAISPVKGTDRVAAALAEVADLPWTWTCAGADDVDPTFAATVREVVGSAGLDDRVRWAGPLVPDDVGRELAAADLLVVGSRVETYGMVVTEALARGIPVVVPPVGGLGEAVGSAADGRRPGLVATSDDPDGLAGAMRAWLADAGLRERLRAVAATRRQEGLPSWEATTDAVAEALVAAPVEPNGRTGRASG